MTGVSLIAVLSFLIGIALSAAKKQGKSNAAADLTEQINRLLPQTQCGQCGYPGCRPYAEAIADGRAAINRCPPGGETTIHALSELLNNPEVPLDTNFGQHKPPQVAVIDESQCIGCTLCLPACPVDAIIGSEHYMHSVIPSQCTGCELCVAPCPVDCIRMETIQAEPEPVPPHEENTPCIHCGLCTSACPVGLEAESLYHHVKNNELSNADTLDQCIECGQCETACPSGILLLDFYRYGKKKIARQQRHDNRASADRRRYEAKQKRRDEQAQRQQTFHQSQRRLLKAKIRESLTRTPQ